MDIGRSIEAAFTSLFNAVPTILGALIVLLIFWIIAGILGKLVTTVLQKLRVDTVLGRIGVERFMQQAGVNLTISTTVGSFIKWFVRILGLTAFCNALNLISVSNFLNQVLAYLPNVLVAVVILLIGSLIAQFAGRLATGAATGARISYANLIGRLVQYAILFFIGLIVLEQLGIGSGIVLGLWAAVTGGLSLALAIAVGLGGRDVANSFLTSKAIGQDLKPGMIVALPDGISGQIAGVGTMFTTLNTNEGQIKLPNNHLSVLNIRVINPGSPTSGAPAQPRPIR